jgi:hypothetical protein
MTESASSARNGEFVQDGRTCGACNDLLVNAASRNAILGGGEPFQYRRHYDDLQEAACSGCILCMMLLDRHEQMGPRRGEAPLCPNGCTWPVLCLKDQSYLTFLVHSPQGGDAIWRTGLRSLLFRGLRGHHSQGVHDWHISFNVSADYGARSMNPRKPLALILMTNDRESISVFCSLPPSRA